MNNKVALVIVVVIAVAAITTISFQQQKAQAIQNPVSADISPIRKQAASVATSGDNNVYITWWSNKTGSDEVMFKASTDAGKTFSDKMNLSNSPKSESQDVQIAASGDNVYVTWWERNQTMNEPFIRISNDNGKSFGPTIMLSASKW
jgi:hypothetical protein